MERLSRTSYHLAKTAFKGHHAGKLSSVYLEAQSAVLPMWKACSRGSAGASYMQMSQIVHTSDCVCMANVLTCTQTCVDCRIQATQENVEVIVDGHSEEKDEGGY